jgi:hypothetical protein
MSVAFIMSTDAQLDFSLGRTVRQKKRVLSVDAMLCPCSPTAIRMTGIWGAEDDRSFFKNIGRL